MKGILSRKFAELRKNKIGEIYYNLILRFNSKSEKYNGNCKIKFYLKERGDGVSFESVSDIKKILVNGKEVKYKRDDIFIVLEEGLEEGKHNEIEIEYEAPYDHTGSGLHQFLDPEDGNEYIYSDFEPYDAHRMFPCFDQPDLKAILKLKVEIPIEWEAIANEFFSEEKIEGNKKIISFNETKKLSTYLFHLSLGNYKYFEDSHKEINMRIYFRKAMEKYVPKEDIFKWTKECLDFYSEFFDYPYPFTKYDQVFAPEFNSGAMENPGAVTLSELYLVRHKPTKTDRANLANTLIHEMAHMWFGDLVTMKWWNDLWLNESFADFMAYFVMVNATEFKDAWEDFYVRKAWAYYQDQLITTHPIANDAEDTDMAFSNFDGISYAKGASVLKQLLFYIGEENFKKSVRTYFKKYEWQNTELKDFLECFEKASNMDLKEWFKVWIETTGVNTIISNFDFSDGKVSNFKIIQEPSKENKLFRNHKTKIALFYKSNGGISPKIIKEINYSGNETFLRDLNFPEGNFQFALLNFEDWDYVKNKFDSQSINWLLDSINEVKDPLTRHLIYGNLWDMVRDAEFSPKKFIDLVIKNAPKEGNLLLLERLMLKIKTSLMFYVNNEVFRDYCNKFFDLSLEMLHSDIDKDRKSSWFSLLNFCTAGISDSKKIDSLLMILNKEIAFKNFELDQDKRWNSIAVLNSIGHKNANDILEKEMDIDKSDRGEKKAAIARVSSLKNKKEFWDMFLLKEGKSSDYLKDAMKGFYWRHQKEDLREYTDLFLNNIKDLFEKYDKHYLRDFFHYLFPGIYIEKDVLNKLKNSLEDFGESNKLLNKYMKEGIDDLERALKIINKY